MATYRFSFIEPEKGSRIAVYIIHRDTVQLIAKLHGPEWDKASITASITCVEKRFIIIFQGSVGIETEQTYVTRES